MPSCHLRPLLLARLSVCCCNCYGYMLSLPTGLPEFIVLVRYVNILEARLRQVEDGRAAVVAAREDPAIFSPKFQGNKAGSQPHVEDIESYTDVMPDVEHPPSMVLDEGNSPLQATRRAVQRSAAPVQPPNPTVGFPRRSEPSDTEARSPLASPPSPRMVTAERAQRSAAPPTPQPVASSSQSGLRQSPSANSRPSLMPQSVAGRMHALRFVSCVLPALLAS